MTISQDQSSLKCIEPTLVQVEDIPAHFEGTGRAEFNEHLARCQFCRQEALEYRQMAGLLHHRLSRPILPARTNCPDSQLISDYLLNLLQPTPRLEIKTHLGTCPFCRVEFARFETDLEAERLAVPSAKWFDSVQDSLAHAIKRVVAQMVPRSLQPALRGRNDESNSAIFQVEDVSVILQVFASGPRKSDLTVTGIVARENQEGPELAGTAVSLLEGTTEIAKEELDSTANFLFELENLDARLEHSLEVKFSGLVVVVPLAF